MAATRMTVLFDGDCRFCTGSAHGIQRRFGKARIALRNFQEPGALDSTPTVTHDAAMKKLHVVTDDGRIFAGAEAIARLVAGVPVVGWLAFVYYVPGLRQLAELAYGFVARNRYRLFGRTQKCEGGTCHLHGA
jgi:predicted DCC family thiol-disulfide oxidoreductase YuxK